VSEEEGVRVSEEEGDEGEEQGEEMLAINIKYIF